MMRINKAVHFLALLTLATVTPSVQALDEDSPWYQVEIILFALNNPVDEVKSEFWREAVAVKPADADDNIPPPPLAEAIPIELVASGINPIIDYKGGYIKQVSLIAADDYRLKTAYERLENAERFVPLLHIAWKQPVDHPDKIQPVYISTDMSTNSEQTVLNDYLMEAPDYALVRDSYADGRLHLWPAPPKIEGTIQLGLSRFLHLKTNIRYRRPLAKRPPQIEGQPPAEPIIELQRFQIDESRRISVDEINYFDHPMFGLIALVKETDPVRIYRENRSPAPIASKPAPVASKPAPAASKPAAGNGNTIRR